MHAEMFIIFIIALFLAQIALMVWKKKHFRSYQVRSCVFKIIFEFFNLCRLLLFLVFGLFHWPFLSKKVGGGFFCPGPSSRCRVVTSGVG